jgi:hypothetical protein
MLEDLGKPIGVNEIGTKFWVSAELTRWARGADSHGTRLPKVTCWIAELASCTRSYLVTEGNTPVFDNQSFEAIAVHIDLMKAELRFTTDEPQSPHN